MFVQQIEYFQSSNLHDIIEYMTNTLKPIRFAGILHDKDIGQDGHLFYNLKVLEV